MQLKYENIYIINGEERKSTDLDKNTKQKITTELEMRIMKVLGYAPTHKNQQNPKS